MAITTKDFFETLYPEINKIKNFRISFGFDWLDKSKDFSRRNIKLEKVSNTVDTNGKLLPISNYSGNLWFCPNLYATYGKAIDTNIKILNAIIIDVDYKRSKYSAFKTYDKMMKKLKEINLLPTIVNSTGHGLQLFFKLENHSVQSNYPFVLIQSSKILQWYSTLTHKLCNILKDYGADPAATNPGRLCRVPESYNFKDFPNNNGKLPYEALEYILNEDSLVKIVYLNEEIRYTLQEIDKITNIESPIAKQIKATTNMKINKSITNMLNPYRLIDLKNLVIKRKGNMNGLRHSLLLIVQQLNGNTTIFNALLDNPLNIKEIENINQWFMNKHKSKISNQRIIEKLNISDNEMSDNLIILSKKEKLLRQHKRDVNKNVKSSYRAIINQLIFNYQILYIKKSRTATNKTLAKELKVTIKTIQRRRRNSMNDEEFKNCFHQTVTMFNNLLEQMLIISDEQNIDLSDSMNALNKTNELITKLNLKLTKKEIQHNLKEIETLQVA